MAQQNRRKHIKQVVLMAIGSICIALGAVGIVLPVLPTTPFVLLAFSCFSLSSPKMARKLEQSKVFGSYLRHWRTHEGIPIKTKVRAITWLWLGLLSSAAIVRKPLVIIILGVIGVIVTLHLVLIKTQREVPGEVLTPKGIDS